MTEKTNVDYILEMAEKDLIRQRSDELIEMTNSIINSPPKTFKELESRRQELFAWGQEINNLRGFVNFVDENFNKPN